ncbi:hypothetical protein QN362_04365 [Actimicrobium sp. CCC2.4]|uniref:hypothetical protein n=1 Tax=Actimicrobium sp. CCC2.4 TaxID=3048606 RepID=UPI002AC8FAB5|nr:hypothetical protein [Actimicrobium sp. CCC2.4]MEB0134562.1 hypothetical protein [Actimicrobium sp. CCC2.4]WPX34004.1 hypothetical protein RHM62_09445 [Actimicrobium sp. CCC2.4]
MTLEQVAAILSRKPEGLRMALLKPKELWAREMNHRKVYIGRRMYFQTKDVALLLDGDLSIGEKHNEENRHSNE